MYTEGVKEMMRPNNSFVVVTDGVCKHQWVWGVCEVCSLCLPSQELLNQYSRQLLLHSSILPCSHCAQGSKYNASHNNDKCFSMRW